MFKVNLSGIFLSLFFAVVAVTQLKNCVDQGATNRSRTLASVENDQALKLTETVIALSDNTSSFLLNGTCLKKVESQTEIGWVVQAENGTVISSGKGECRNGNFSAQVEGFETVKCEDVHWLKLSLSSRNALFETRAEVSKNCPPLSRTPASNKSKTKCFYETRMYSSGKQCTHSCYLDGVVTGQKIVDAENCGLNSTSKPQ